MNTTGASIRITDYNGDFDTLNEVTLIGPYPSEAAADAEARRLYSIEGIYGLYDFEASDLFAPDMIDPALFSQVTTVDEVAEVIYSS